MDASRLISQKGLSGGRSEQVGEEVRPPVLPSLQFECVVNEGEYRPASVEVVEERRRSMLAMHEPGFASTSAGTY